MEVEVTENLNAELPLGDLQKLATELLDGIRDVDEDIRKVTGRNFSEIRRFNSRNIRKKVDRDNLPKIAEDIPERKDRKRISAHVHSDTHNEKEKSPIPIMSEVVCAEKIELVAPDEKESMLDEESCKRSKRMFGHLLGTLNKFKLENENQKDVSQKRQEIDMKLEERAKKEHEIAIQQKKELLQLRMEKQRNLRRLRRQIWLKELEEKTGEYFETLSASIFIGGDEAIFYSPAKHNETTLSLLNRSKETFMKRKEEYLPLIPDFFQNHDNAQEEIIDVEKEPSSHESSSNEDNDTGPHSSVDNPPKTSSPPP